MRRCQPGASLALGKCPTLPAGTAAPTSAVPTLGGFQLGPGKIGPTALHPSLGWQQGEEKVELGAAQQHQRCRLWHSEAPWDGLRVRRVRLGGAHGCSSALGCSVLAWVVCRDKEKGGGAECWVREVQRTLPGWWHGAEGVLAAAAAASASLGRARESPCLPG